MKEAVALLQLALLAMRFVNWVTGYVDRKTWEGIGYQKAMSAQAALLSRSLGLADKAVEEAKKATPEERRKSLESDL